MDNRIFWMKSSNYERQGMMMIPMTKKIRSLNVNPLQSSSNFQRYACSDSINKPLHIISNLILSIFQYVHILKGRFIILCSKVKRASRIIAALKCYEMFVRSSSSRNRNTWECNKDKMHFLQKFNKSWTLSLKSNAKSVVNRTRKKKWLFARKPQNGTLPSVVG